MPLGRIYFAIKRTWRTVPAHVLVPSLLVASGLLVFWVIAGNVMEGDTRAFDEWVLKVLRTGEKYETLRGPTWAKGYALDLTTLGSYPMVSLTSLIVLGFLLMKRWYHEAWILAFVTIGGWLLNTLLKGFFARPRPAIVVHLVQVEAQSFPSGHAMIAAVFYPAIGTLIAELTSDRRMKRYVIAVSLMLAVAVGGTRVVLGVHYPTDVIAGWVAGVTWSLLCLVAMRLARDRGWLRKPG
jgi:undecaprenyl-diphosphatase